MVVGAQNMHNLVSTNYHLSDFFDTGMNEKETQSLSNGEENKKYDLKHSLCKLNALHPNYFVHSKLCTKYILKSSSPSSPTTFSFFMCFLPKFQHLKEQKQEFL